MYRVPSRARPRQPARRKPTEQRRVEIVSAACQIALADGLDSVTLRRIADTLGVFPGLVSYYFPSVGDLVAEAFGDVMTHDRDETFAMIEATAPAHLLRMRELLLYMLNDDRDRISLLWLDAGTARVTCGCRKYRHLTRPANIRGSGRQAGRVAGCGSCRRQVRRKSCRQVVPG